MFPTAIKAAKANHVAERTGPTRDKADSAQTSMKVRPRGPTTVLLSIESPSGDAAIELMLVITVSYGQPINRKATRQDQPN